MMPIPNFTPFTGTPPNRNTDTKTTFSDHVDTLVAWITGTLSTYLSVFPDAANDLAAEVSGNKESCDSAVVAAQAAQNAAEAASTAAAWVSGTTYSIGAVRFSPITFASFRRKTAGAGTTDPSLDTVNWVPLHFPSQTGNGGKCLVTDGGVVSWSGNPLPSQVGQSGKVLKTVSEVASWGVVSPDVQVFLSSSSWYKPSDRATNARVFVQVWGGGGSGGMTNAGGSNGAGGGGGGAYAEGWMSGNELPSSVTVTVGSGVAQRNPGGNGYSGGSSSFGSYILAFGGGGGGIGNNPVYGGGGGGPIGIGGTGTGVQGLPTTSTFWHGSAGGGVTTAPSTPSQSLFGGGGGGSALNGGAVSSGAVGMVGGSGGAGSSSGNATAGSVPGGGGGGCSTMSGGTGGAGGSGKVIITVF